MKSDRLLGIVLLLNRRSKVSAKELSEYFDVSVRTIQRDIDAISAAGIPIYADRGKEGGYSLLENYKIKQGFFTDKEVRVLLKVLNGVKSGYDSIYIKNIIEKIEVVRDQNPDYTDDKLEIDFSYWGDSSELKRRIAMVERAIDSELVISMKYGGAARGISQRDIEPHKLLNKSGVWYVLAFCRLRKDFRLFKIARFIDPKTTQKRFKRKPLPEESLESNWEEDRVQKVKFKIYKEALSRGLDLFVDGSREVLEDGTVIVETQFPNNDWAYGFIMGFGESLEVLEPQSLREAIKERLKASLDRYSE